jgi:hypothetical protein
MSGATLVNRKNLIVLHKDMKMIFTGISVRLIITSRIRPPKRHTALICLMERKDCFVIIAEHMNCDFVDLEPNFRHFKIVLEIVYKTPNLRKQNCSQNEMQG